MFCPIFTQHWVVLNPAFLECILYLPLYICCIFCFTLFNCSILITKSEGPLPNLSVLAHSLIFHKPTALTDKTRKLYKKTKNIDICLSISLCCESWGSDSSSHRSWAQLSGLAAKHYNGTMKNRWKKRIKDNSKTCWVCFKWNTLKPTSRDVFMQKLSLVWHTWKQQYFNLCQN